MPRATNQAFDAVFHPVSASVRREASHATIEAIKASRRYDPGRYTRRAADRELSRLWQTAFRHKNDAKAHANRVRLIALVSDSGMGKTSLVCEFTRDLGRVLPVLLIQARDLMFASEDNLVLAVIEAAQGVLDPSARVIEEAALSMHLGRYTPLTVVVDGLDEAHAPQGVRNAISFWL